MAEAVDWSWLGEAVVAPEITFDDWLQWPEDVCKRIEVEDGKLIQCHSASYSHQTIQYNLQTALRNATKKWDVGTGECHRISGDLDVLFTEVPFHYRKQDVIVFRCIPEDRSTRSRWGDRPFVSDVLIAVEIVSRTSAIEDLRTKRALYAGAGIPHYWIVRMAGDDGPAVSIERCLLTSDGSYVTEALALRDRDLFAVDTLNPFRLRISWEEMDADL